MSYTVEIPEQVAVGDAIKRACEVSRTRLRVYVIATNYRVRLPGLRGGYWRNRYGPQPADDKNTLHRTKLARA